MGIRLLPDLRQRCRQPELMDQPDLDEDLHRNALCGLARLNALQRSSSLLWPYVHRLASEIETRPIRILDIACGGGDVAIGLWRKATVSALEVELTGCDISPVALEHARENARFADARIDFQQLDAINGGVPGQFDVVMCSLFLHHLPEYDAITLLRRMAEMTRHLVLVNDLLRTRLAYVGAWTLSRLFSRSKIVHADGPLSVQAAFTAKEAREIAVKAGLSEATVSTFFFQQRYVLQWSRKNA